MLAGCLLLLASAVLTLAAIETTSAAAFLAGVAVAGAGFGTATLGAHRTISCPAGSRPAGQPDRRHLYRVLRGVQRPVVVAGVAVTHAGLHRTALVYRAVIAVLAAVAAGSLIVRGRSPVPGTRSSGGTSQ
jgi:hypothetical protein